MNDEIKVSSIGVNSWLPDLNKEENLKLRLLNDFLTHEFTRDVGVGTEYLYQISEIIAKEYFDLPPEIQHAWCYPSVVEKPSMNVCFRPQVARRKLRLLGVQIATCKRENKDMLFSVKCIASGFNGDGVFRYRQIGSEVQRLVFPGIQITD
jgi:hypothetical protein